MKKIISFSVLLFCTTIYAQVPSYVPTNGLVGYWPFNGNANDESGNGNNGVVNGAALTADRFGNPNKSYSFANSETIEIASQPSLNIAPNYSIALWYLTTADTFPAQDVMIKGTNDFTGQSCYLRHHSSTYSPIPDSEKFAYVSGAQMPYTNLTSSLPSMNTWHFVVINIQNSQADLYIDNNLINSVFFPNLNNMNNNSPLKIGGGYYNFNGKIDDIGFWNRSLTQQEITAMYNGETYSDTCNSVSGSLTQGLVGYWPFCGNANDDSGHGNNGTVNGATLTTDRFGNSNSAYDFDGLTSYIYGVGVNLPQGDTTRTVSLWVKTGGGFSANTGGTTGVVFNYGTLSFIQRFGVLLDDNTLNNYLCSQSNDYPTFNPVPANTWTNIVWVYSNTNLYLYINGILTTTGTILNINTIGQNFVFGNTIPNSWGQYEKYKGTIDDIGIWNRALTPSEISQLYNQNQCFTNTTVTDTLIINLGQLSYSNPIAYANNITLYPNPANTQVNISFNNVTDLTGGTINIINSLGQQVDTTPITLSGTNTTMSLTTWGGTGLYFVQILNAQGQILDIKKIILQ